MKGSFGSDGLRTGGLYCSARELQRRWATGVPI